MDKKTLRLCRKLHNAERIDPRLWRRFIRSLGMPPRWQQVTIEREQRQMTRRGAK